MAIILKTKLIINYQNQIWLKLYIKTKTINTIMLENINN